MGLTPGKVVIGLQSHVQLIAMTPQSSKYTALLKLAEVLDELKSVKWTQRVNEHGTSAFVLVVENSPLENSWN